MVLPCTDSLHTLLAGQGGVTRRKPALEKKHSSGVLPGSPLAWPVSQSSELLCHEFYNLFPDSSLSFLGGGADVRGHANLRVMQKALVLAGLFRIDVNPGTGQLS